MEIDKTTNMPKHIPPRATSKVDFRCYPEVKARVKANADAREISLTKIILEALNVYWEVKAQSKEIEYAQ